MTTQNENSVTIVAVMLADLLSEDFSAGCIVDLEADLQSRYFFMHSLQIVSLDMII